MREVWCTLVWAFVVGEKKKKSIHSAGVYSEAVAKDWMVPQIKLIPPIPCQLMLLLFVYFLTVPALLLFPTVISHICICFPVETVLGLQRVLAGCYAASLPCCLLWRSFAMLFHPLPSYRRVPFELFKSGLGYCSVPLTTSTKPRLWFVGLGKEVKKTKRQFVMILVN